MTHTWDLIQSQTSTLHQRKGRTPPAVHQSRETMIPSRDNVMPGQGGQPVGARQPCGGSALWVVSQWGGGSCITVTTTRHIHDSIRPSRLRRARPKNQVAPMGLRITLYKTYRFRFLPLLKDVIHLLGQFCLKSCLVESWSLFLCPSSLLNLVNRRTRSFHPCFHDLLTGNGLVPPLPFPAWTSR